MFFREFTTYLSGVLSLLNIGNAKVSSLHESGKITQPLSTSRESNKTIGVKRGADSSSRIFDSAISSTNNSQNDSRKRFKEPSHNPKKRVFDRLEKSNDPTTSSNSNNINEQHKSNDPPNPTATVDQMNSFAKLSGFSTVEEMMRSYQQNIMAPMMTMMMNAGNGVFPTFPTPVANPFTYQPTNYQGNNFNPEFRASSLGRSVFSISR